MTEKAASSFPHQAGRTLGPVAKATNWVDSHLTIVFNVPTVVFLTGLVAFPIGLVIIYSFASWEMIQVAELEWIGFQNYTAMWGDTRWLNSVWHTFYFAVTAVVLQLILGMAIALLFNRNFYGKTLYRSLFILPMVAMPTAISLVWIVMFNTSYGVLNQFLGKIGIPAIPWTTDANWVIPSLILVQVWQWTPFMTLLILAGLQSLPTDPFEAAVIDGANPWQRFWHVTLPLLKGHIMVALILRSIFGIKEFDTILSITDGGPAWASEVMNVNIYFNAFVYGHLGSASARGVVFFLIILGIQMMLIQLRKRQWSY